MGTSERMRFSFVVDLTFDPPARRYAIDAVRRHMEHFNASGAGRLGSYSAKFHSDKSTEDRDEQPAEGG